jgi:hypothetical protein
MELLDDGNTLFSDVHQLLSSDNYDMELLGDGNTSTPEE